MMRYISTNKGQEQKRQAEISRVISAAVVNRQFCQSLLANPHKTLQSGFAGEMFHLPEEESRRIGAIRAASLAEFAAQLAQI